MPTPSQPSPLPTAPATDVSGQTDPPDTNLGDDPDDGWSALLKYIGAAFVIWQVGAWFDRRHSKEPVHEDTP